MSEKPTAKPSRPAGVSKYRRTDAPTYRRTDVAVPDGFLAVGKIVGVHGLRGELKVELYTDFPERFEEGITLWAGRGGDDELDPVTVAGARLHKNLLLLHLDGVLNREDGEALRGTWLFVDEEEAVELDDDTFFVHDILGLQVVTDAGAVLGRISDVLFTGANEVYVVSGAGLPTGELLLPATDEVIRSVVLETGVMTVHLIPGLLDDTEAPAQDSAETHE